MRLEEEKSLVTHSQVDLVLVKIPCICTALQKSSHLLPDSRISIKNGIIESHALPRCGSSFLFTGFPPKHTLSSL